MTERIDKPAEKTLGDFIKNRYADFTITDGNAPLDTDISHGIEIEYWESRNGKSVKLYPFILWTDGGYNPCHYWGDEHYIRLRKEV